MGRSKQLYIETEEEEHFKKIFETSNPKILNKLTFFEIKMLEIFRKKR
jgi:hypothetical protein